MYTILSRTFYLAWGWQLKKTQEAVLLDLLRVISHHRARLATPIRTVQKVYSDAEMDNIPFSDTIVTHVNRPLLLIEPPQRINGEDKAKVHATPRPNEEQAAKSTESSSSSEPKPCTVIDGTVQSSSEKQQQVRSTPLPNEEQALKSTASSEPKPTTVIDGTAQSSSEKQQQKKTNSAEIRPKSNKRDSKSQLEGSEKSSLVETASDPVEVTAPPAVKNENEKPMASSPSVARPAYEQNLVLNVAIEGSKKTLPIEEEEIKPVPLPVEASEMAGSRSSNGSSPANVKDRKGKMPAAEQRDQER